jgi:hypothetical protein
MSASNTMCRNCEHDAGRVWLDLTWRPVLVTARIAGQRSMVAMLMMCWMYVRLLVQLQGGSVHLGWCSSFMRHLPRCHPSAVQYHSTATL